MKMRLLLAVLALVGMTAGCVLVSGQITVDFDLADAHVVGPATLVSQTVDLNTIGDYNDHKSDLQGLADVALLGTITNNGSSPVDVEVWMTTTQTSYLLESDVKANGVRLWGPFHLAAGETRRTDWDGSAALFDAAGKTALIGEIKGDGVFTLYAVGKQPTYDFSIQDGHGVLVLDTKF
jgi:hypothetical protein